MTNVAWRRFSTGGISSDASIDVYAYGLSFCLLNFSCKLKICSNKIFLCKLSACFTKGCLHIPVPFFFKAAVNKYPIWRLKAPSLVFCNNSTQGSLQDIHFPEHDFLFSERISCSVWKMNKVEWLTRQTSKFYQKFPIRRLGTFYFF